MSGLGEQSQVEGTARCGVFRALSRAPEGRLQLRVLPRRRPSRRGGPDGADIPAGLPPLRARTARIARQAAASVADPHCAQPGCEPLSRPLAQACVADRRDDAARCAAHDRAARGGQGRAEQGLGGRADAARRSARGADHALCARHGQPRDRARNGPHGRSDEGADSSCDQAARGDRRAGARGLGRRGRGGS